MPSARTSPPRRKLMSMRVSAEVRDFVLDQLSGLRGLRAQPMFGGLGLYADEVFFGILAADVLYFKVDDTTRPAYEAAGSTPFKPYADRPMTMAYYRVPVDVLEAAPTLVAWAKQAVAAARASKGAPAAGGRVKAKAVKATKRTRPKRG
jgi:DNA transformation protein